MQLIRIGVAAAAAFTLAGCAPKASVQKWEGSMPALPPYMGPVCLLPGPLPEGTEYTFLGRAVGNMYTYGSFATVENTLADKVRTVGADTVYDKRMKMKIAPIPWGAARPQIWGMAVRLKAPEKFDCVASGGRLFGNGQRLPVQKPADVATPVLSGSSYDDCMRRVLRISDSDLRLQAIEACDAAQ